MLFSLSPLVAIFYIMAKEKFEFAENSIINKGVTGVA